MTKSKPLQTTGNPPRLCLTLSTTLQQIVRRIPPGRPKRKSEDKKKPAAKKGKGIERTLVTFRRSFLMYTAPEETTTPKNIPQAMFGSPPKKKYPFKIAYKLLFSTVKPTFMASASAG